LRFLILFFTKFNVRTFNPNLRHVAGHWLPYFSRLNLRNKTVFSVPCFTSLIPKPTPKSASNLKEKALANTDHLYKYTLKNPNAAIKVVATDRFGNVYSETKFTTDLSSASSY
jgi:hypothetical protein